jgi:hypothetical protein
MIKWGARISAETAKGQRSRIGVFSIPAPPKPNDHANALGQRYSHEGAGRRPSSVALRNSMTASVESARAGVHVIDEPARSVRRRLAE